MNITREEIDKLSSVIKLEIAEEDYLPNVDSALRQQRRNAQMPGFRKGKVPMGIIKKTYGSKFKMDEINRLISEKLLEYIKEEELPVIGEPMPSEERNTPSDDFANQKDFEFYFEIGLAPQVNINFEETTLPYYVIKVEDKFIEESIKGFQKQFSERKVRDEITEDEMLVGDFVEVNQEGEAIENGIEAEEVTISLKMMKDDDIKKMFIGKKNDEEIIFNVKKAYPNEAELANMLNIDKELVEEMTGDFKFTISEIAEFIPAEVNAELFQNAFPEDDIETEEEFRERIARDYREEFEHSSDYKLKEDFVDNIIEEQNIELPESILKRKLLQEHESLNKDNIDQEFEKMRKSLKWIFIKQEIAKKYDIKVSEEEIANIASEKLMQQVQQSYGFDPSLLGAEFFESQVQELLKDEKNKDNLAQEVVDIKAIQIIKENVKRDEKEVSLEEFKAIMGIDNEKQENEEKSVETDSDSENEETNENQTQNEEEKNVE